jgi:hypothetical protein
MYKPTGQARLLVDGMIVYATKQKASHRDDIRCGYGCKHANPDSECQCVCQGENHGIENIANIEVAGELQEDW